MRYPLMLTLVMLAFLAGVVTGRYYLPQPTLKVSIIGPTALGPGRLPPNPDPQAIRSPAKPGLPPASHLARPTPDSPTKSGPVTVHSTQPVRPERLDSAEPARQKRLKHELADSLREQGLSEEEIEAQMQGRFPPPPDLEEQYSPYELSMEDKEPEELRAELNASLKETGITPEDIEQHLDAIMAHIQAESESPDQPQ